jgi:hypothetical protein
MPDATYRVLDADFPQFAPPDLRRGFFVSAARFLALNAPRMSGESENRIAGGEGEHDENQENDKEDEEQDFRDPCRRGGNARKTEETGNQRDDQKDESPFQHGIVSFTLMVR